MTAHLSATVLQTDVRELISSARQRVASVVNAELTQLYWQIGRRIKQEVLQGQRAEYGKQVLAGLAQQLTTEFGKGWSLQQLRHCIQLAEIFPDEHILSTVQRELTWPHINALIYIGDSLNSDFYIEICRVEHWSVRQLQERINSMLFERTTISRKPEDTIRQDLAQPPRHCEQRPSPSLRAATLSVIARSEPLRHCEERSDAAIHAAPGSPRACGPRDDDLSEALAMTTPLTVIARSEATRQSSYPRHP